MKIILVTGGYVGHNGLHPCEDMFSIKVDQEVSWYIGQITRPKDLEIKIMLQTEGQEHYFNFRVAGSGYLPNIPWHLLIYFH